ncbi:MAG: hypothetical protein ACRYFX_10205 [Janthinobacterium lividum]
MQHTLTRIAAEWQTVTKFDRFPKSPQTREQLDFVRGYRAVWGRVIRTPLQQALNILVAIY